MKARLGTLMMLLGSWAGTGSAMQQTTSPSQMPTMPTAADDMQLGGTRSRLDDSGFRGKLEADRARTANAQRQKTMAREATELLYLAGELQMSAEKLEAEPSREEMLRKLETIEKLAHNVKERMKGSR